MRDIRDDLTERIGAVSQEYAQLQAKLEGLVKQKVALEALLAEENARWNGVVQTELFVSANTNGHEISPLGQMLLSILSDGATLTTEKLAEAAVNRQYPFGHKAPGRSVHFGCVALHNAGLIQKKPNGWKKQDIS